MVFHEYKRAPGISNWIVCVVHIVIAGTFIGVGETSFAQPRPNIDYGWLYAVQDILLSSVILLCAAKILILHAANLLVINFIRSSFT